MTTAGEATLKLRVAEALNKDVARAFARIGPEDLEKIGAASGDIVEVSGKRTTVCKAMLAHMDMTSQLGLMTAELLTAINLPESAEILARVWQRAIQPQKRRSVAPAQRANRCSAGARLPASAGDEQARQAPHRPARSGRIPRPDGGSGGGESISSRTPAL